MEEKQCQLEQPKYKGVDDEFNPILLHTLDDERTLDEEEALEPTEDPQTELQNLQREGDMPLEELLKLCGYTTDGRRADDSDCSDNGESAVKRKKKTGKKVGAEKKDDCKVEEPVKSVVKEEIDEDDDMEEEKPERSALCQLYDDLPDTTSGGSRPLRSLRPQSEEEEEDNDYSPDEEELKKTIMVGSNYQAYIPEGMTKYDDALPYENDDKLLWDPSSVEGDQMEKYLGKAHQLVINSGQGVSTIPLGAHTRDDEHALYLLLQCDYNMEEALRRMKMNVSGGADNAMSLWSEEECRNFEAGLRMYGKNFHLIQLNKVRTRTVGELVQFYYLWKKTERHDIFAHKARLEKKKYTLHPGITDYMDRFLEDQDSAGGNESGVAATSAGRDRSLSPNVNSLIYADHKRQSRSVTSSPRHESGTEPVKSESVNVATVASDSSPKVESAASV